MSFRKRFVPLASKSSTSPSISSQTQPSSSDGQPTTSSPAGVRPSPLSGIPTLSTGTPTLDSLLGGHSGLPLGTSLLISENGTTDYAGALLRLYAAEGVMQGCQVHVVGAPGGEAWGRELPGLAGVKAEKEEGRLGVGTGREVDKEKMKIAWRYEGLGREREKERGAWSLLFSCRYIRDKYTVLVPITHAPEYFHPALHAELIADTKPLQTANLPQRTSLSSSSPATPSDAKPSLPPPAPCPHSFDLTKRLIPPPSTPPIKYHSIPLDSSITGNLPTLQPVLDALSNSLLSSPTTQIHRVVISSFLNPLIYPPNYSNPKTTISFIHNLRVLLRTHPRQFSIMLSLPLDLYPRSTGLTRWMEILVDGSIELTPFPHAPPISAPTTSTTSKGGGGGGGGAGGRGEENLGEPQGLLKVHKVPVNSEKGESIGGEGEWAFWMSRRRFVVQAWSLPPVEGEEGEKGREGVAYEF